MEDDIMYKRDENVQNKCAGQKNNYYSYYINK